MLENSCYGNHKALHMLVCEIIILQQLLQSSKNLLMTYSARDTYNNVSYYYTFLHFSLKHLRGGMYQSQMLNYLYSYKHTKLQI